MPQRVAAGPPREKQIHTLACSLPKTAAAAGLKPGQLATNAHRAQWASIALRVFPLATGVQGEDLDTQLSDLLCDLMHLHAQAPGSNALHFTQLVGRAGEHFREEVLEEQAEEPL